MMRDLNLRSAEAIIDGALASARAAGLDPLVVAVHGRDGGLLALRREDGAPAGFATIAQAKASGSLAMGRSSRRLEAMARDRPGLLSAVGGLFEVFPAPGGVLIRDDEGRTMGAVGVSGDTGDNDEAMALAGIAAAGLQSDDP